MASIPTPVPHFPADVLRRIFKDVCMHRPILLPRRLSDKRHILSSVCDEWAAIVNMTPSLWDDIHFTKPENVLYPPQHLLRQFRYCIRRSAQNHLSISFDMVCEGWQFSIVNAIIMPFRQRIKALCCPIYRDNDIETFFGIDADDFSALEAVDICLINTWENPISCFPLRRRLQFDALRGAPRLTKVAARLLNGFRPIDLRLPWESLTTLDLGTSPITPAEFISIVTNNASILEQGFFYIEFVKLRCPFHILPNVTMTKLRSVRLRLLYPCRDTQLFSALRFPSLLHIWIEMSDQFQDWDISLYINLLRTSSQSLRQLRLSDFSPPQFDNHTIKYRSNEIPYQSIEELFNVIPNVENLYLPLGIPVHAPTIEKMAACMILPRLCRLELGTCNPEHIINMIARRNVYTTPLSGPSRLAARVQALYEQPTALRSIYILISRDGYEEDEHNELVADAKRLLKLGAGCTIVPTQHLPLPMSKPATLARSNYFNLPLVLNAQNGAGSS